MRIHFTRSHLVGVLRLTRYREYIWFVVVSTCLGTIAAYGAFGWKLAVVLLANELAVSFAFMINDVEDAADDALDAAKAQRNPVSAGLLSPGMAYGASFLAALLAVGLYAVLGRWPLLIGLSCLLLAFFYSWRPVRLKAMPLADLISHALMLAGLQFAAAYVTFSLTLGPRFFWPFVMAVAISMYGELFNELRDLEGDRRAGVMHTV
ncbi:MAG: UbiA family prenyltransferase, partial [Anaerolineae bacterium]|nr:UbiA family prenyltransferase [Anaerolineae bacterium]